MFHKSRKECSISRQISNQLVVKIKIQIELYATKGDCPCLQLTVERPRCRQDLIFDSLNYRDAYDYE